MVVSEEKRKTTNWIPCSRCDGAALIIGLSPSVSGQVSVCPYCDIGIEAFRVHIDNNEIVIEPRKEDVINGKIFN
jgi:hypothetical protein